MATVHTLRVGEGLEYANQALGWHPQPRGPVCDWRKRFYWWCGAVEGDGGGWGAGGQSWVGLPALPSVTGWEMDSLVK